MVRGSYFDARTARNVPAELDATAGGQWRLVLGDGGELLLEPWQVRVSDRIGSVPRRLHLPGGAEFETRDNDGVDALLHQVGLPGRGGAVHALERRWGIALGALVAVVLVVFLSIRYGLPAASGWVAHRMPAEADLLIGEQVLEVLDSTLMRPTRLSTAERLRMQGLFARVTAGLDDGHAYRLELRYSRIGPNALALPSGIVVVTDAMVVLADNDEELLAVLAHEVGHVRGRHSLRQLIQNAGISALALAVLGDVGSVSAVLSSAGPVLLQLQNSRNLEREADAFSRAWLQANGIDPVNFDRILCRMPGAGYGDDPMLFLSTHPPTSERARCGAGGEAGAGDAAEAQSPSM